MEARPRSATQMKNMFLADPKLLEQLKTDPVRALNETAPKAEAVTTPEYMRDKWLYRIAIGVLGTLALVAAIGSVILVLEGDKTPEVLVALGSAAVGALVGLFAPSPTGK